MRLHRFYIEEKIGGKSEVKIFDENLLHQIKSVFRLEAGDAVILFDGEGYDFQCEIRILAKKEGVFEVMNKSKAFVPAKKVTLFLSIIKKDNFELASRMATEIGVSKIVPILTERSEKKNVDLERLRRIVKEASEQCGRGDVPAVAEITNLQDLVFNEGEEIVVADFGAVKIRDLRSSKSNTEVSFFVGPEGGWTDEEREIFKRQNACFVSLGETMFRAETAVAAGSAILMQI